MSTSNAFPDVSTTEFAVQLVESAHEIGDELLARELAGLGLAGERCARSENILRRQLVDAGRSARQVATQLNAKSIPPPALY